MKAKFAILFLLLSSVSFCQNPNAGYMGYAGVGLCVPINGKEFYKNYAGGYNFNGGAGYVFDRTYAARLDLQYNNFAFREKDPVYTNHFISITVTGNILAGDLYKNSSLKSYAAFGFGASINTVKITNKNEFSSHTSINLGLGIGIGAIIKASEKIGVFTEFQYMFIFQDGIEKGYVPVKAGITYNM